MSTPSLAPTTQSTDPGPPPMSADPGEAGRMPRPLALSAVFRGWQWPLRDGDTVRVYGGGERELVAELPARFVLELIEHYLRAAELQARVVAHLAPRPWPAPAPPESRPRAPLPVPRLPAATGRRLRGYPTPLDEPGRGA